jgi:dolichol kinase
MVLCLVIAVNNLVLAVSTLTQRATNSAASAVNFQPGQRQSLTVPLASFIHSFEELLMKTTIKGNAENLIFLAVLLLLIGSVWALFGDNLLAAVSMAAIGGCLLALVGTTEAELLDDVFALTMDSVTLKPE